MKLLLSIDGSTTKTGYAIYKIYQNGQFSLKESGVINPPKQKKNKGKTKTEKKISRSQGMDYRLQFILNTLFEILVKEKNIGYIVAEDTYLGKDANAYKWLCRLQGFLMGYAKVKNLIFFVSAPTHWRKYLGISVREGNHFYKRDELKEISKSYVKNELHLDITDEDEIEAVLIGYSKCLEMGLIEKDKK